MKIVNSLKVRQKGRGAEVASDDAEETQLTKLGQDLSKTFLNKDFADIQVKCGKKTFDCHRVILAARSRVLKTMLSSDGSEQREMEIEIVDFDAEVIFQMLQFIYTGKFDDPFNGNDAEDMDMETELLRAADKYELDSMKALCEEKLANFLYEENCLRVFILADSYQAFELKKDAFEVIIRNRKVVFKSEDWEKCVKNHPDLAVEITRTEPHDEHEHY